mmetsp:Transcript_29097/g.54435  ORF Transcript_29097/g.54435 Transcript_29097/m.54435 type:complete len:133 (-) Transcript_29097:802-1200(-)
MWEKLGWTKKIMRVLSDIKARKSPRRTHRKAEQKHVEPGEGGSSEARPTKEEENVVHQGSNASSEPKSPRTQQGQSTESKAGSPISPISTGNSPTLTWRASIRINDPSAIAEKEEIRNEILSDSYGQCHDER